VLEQVLGHHDLLKLVLGKISLIDLCAATTVCRQWRDVARSDDFWSDVDFEAPVREEQARERDGSDHDARGIGASPGRSSIRRQQRQAEQGSRRVMAHQVLIAAASLRAHGSCASQYPDPVQHMSQSTHRQSR